MTVTSGAAATEKLKLERKLAASPQRVYRAWTTPAEVKSWWGKRIGFVVEEAVLDLRVGGKFRLAMRSPEKNAHIVNGVFREVVAGRRIGP